MSKQNGINVLSLFDGISCARVALDRLGIKINNYYSSEIDKYAIQVAMRNYPDTVQLGSVTELDGTKLKDIDLLIGGFPCTDLSIAKNNRQGLKGEHSGLFYEMLRVHREVKPKYFVYENVNSMAKDQQAIILSEIQKIDPTACVIMINASLVSAQNRKRLFFTNIQGITQPEDKWIMLKDVLEDNPAIAPIKSHTIRTSGRGSGIGDKHNWDTIRIGQIGKGGQGDRIYSTEGKSVNLSANGGDKANAMTTVPTDSMVMEDTIIRKLTPIECERLQSLPDSWTEGVSNSQRYKMLGNAFNAKVVEHVLSFMK